MKRVLNRRKRGARSTRTLPSSPIVVAEASRITPGDVTFVSEWAPGPLRQKITTSFLVASQARSYEVQWRINTERYVTVWADCPLRDPSPATTRNRTLGTILCPANQPGAGRNLAEFLPQLEDMWKVQLRHRASPTHAWTQESLNLVVPQPATGSFQFNTYPTTVAQLKDAVLAANAFGSGLYAIGLNGEYVLPSPTDDSLRFTGINKPGEPLLISSVNRSSPANFRGYSGRCWNWRTSTNIILDRFDLRNNITQMRGWDNPDPEGEDVPFLEWPCGGGVGYEGVLRSYIQNLYMRDLDVCIELRDCDHVYVGFVETDRYAQDGIRLFRRNGNIIIEGEYQHDPNTYNLLALSDFTPNYHPDDTQLSSSIDTGSNWFRPAIENGELRNGGNQDIRRVRGVSLGLPIAGHYTTQGYWGEEVIRNRGWAPDSPDAQRYMNRNWLWDGMYVESSWNAFPLAQFVEGFILRNSVARQAAPDTRIPIPNFQHYCRNVRIENIVVNVSSTHRGYYAIPGSPAPYMSATQMQDEITTVGVIKSATAWPVGWSPEEGRNRYPHGPDAYRLKWNY